MYPVKIKNKGVLDFFFSLSVFNSNMYMKITVSMPAYSGRAGIIIKSKFSVSPLFLFSCKGLFQINVVATGECGEIKTPASATGDLQTAEMMGSKFGQVCLWVGVVLSVPS